MSNRRDLKRVINNSMSILYRDCMIYIVYTKEPKLEKVETILEDIQKLQDDLLSRTSNTEGKELKSRTKTYFNKIKEDLKNGVDRLGKEIQNLD